MLTTAIPTVLAHAAHGAHRPGHEAPNVVALVGLVGVPALLIFALLLLRRRDVITAAICLFSAGAAQLHAVATGEHLQEHVAFGVFFMAVTLLQVGWIVAAIWRPSMPTLAVGVGVNLVVLAVWAASRTTGLPVGPEPWTAESVGLLDLASGTFEFAVVAGCLRLARTSPVEAPRSVPATAVS